MNVKKTQHSGSDKKPSMLETGTAKTNSSEGSHGSVSDSRRPPVGVSARAQSMHLVQFAAEYPGAAEYSVCPCLSTRLFKLPQDFVTNFLPACGSQQSPTGRPESRRRRTHRRAPGSRGFSTPAEQTNAVAGTPAFSPAPPGAAQTLPALSMLRVPREVKAKPLPALMSAWPAPAAPSAFHTERAEGAAVARRRRVVAPQACSHQNRREQKFVSCSGLGFCILPAGASAGRGHAALAAKLLLEVPAERLEAQTQRGPLRETEPPALGVGGAGGTPGPDLSWPRALRLNRLDSEQWGQQDEGEARRRLPGATRR
uniref:Uncharacterized protein n=1 Tax=Rangifer tarandus platyrhynchus TaxID=3082113 RepID=A0ACB0FGV2_RANTA|nr:unnamed protein product [Rangifer tarandus platyrhynchus]